MEKFDFPEPQKVPSNSGHEMYLVRKDWLDNVRAAERARCLKALGETVEAHKAAMNLYKKNGYKVNIIKHHIQGIELCIATINILSDE